MRKSSLLSGLAGLSVTALVIAFARHSGGAADAAEALLSRSMAVAFAAGFALRVLRRKIFLGSAASLHKSFSFDAIFQGAILLNPQLPYPAVECEFLQRNTSAGAERVLPWFRIRSTSAASIPLLLAGIVFFFAGKPWSGAVLACASGVWVAYRAWFVAERRKTAFAAATFAGMAAAAAEGFAFVAAARIISPAIPAWNASLLYAILLTAFELSPVPFALGVLEAAWAALALVPGIALPSVWLVMAYRVWRAVPVLALTLFYLPRYKMSVRDLYDPGLAHALAPKHRREIEETAGGPLLSIVIPAYNEALRLPRYLPDVQAFCATLQGGCEILVVDDGSTDRTAQYVDSVAHQDTAVRLIRQDRNRGKGAAVRRGVSEARGAYVLFADADGATPIEESWKLLERAREAADVVIGSRKAAGDVRRERSWARELVGSAFYRITNLLAVPGIEDTQCGFKIFRRTAARAIFPQLTETGWAFDVELLFVAQKLGMRIEEVPVNWSAVEGSKIRPKDALKMFAALVRIRRRAAGLTQR